MLELSPQVQVPVRLVPQRPGERREVEPASIAGGYPAGSVSLARRPPSGESSRATDPP